MDNLGMKDIMSKYYKELNIEFKKKYEEFNFILLYDKQQIEKYERYALDIAFWKNEMIIITPDCDGKTLAQSFMATRSHADIIKNITTNFNKTIQKRIMMRVDQLLSRYVYEQERRAIIEACNDITRTDVDDSRCGICWLACEGSCSQAGEFIRANIPSLCVNTAIEKNTN